MLDFRFDNKTEIIFGKGYEGKVGAETRKYSKKKVLLHYGGGSIKKNRFI